MIQNSQRISNIFSILAVFCWSLEPLEAFVKVPAPLRLSTSLLLDTNSDGNDSLFDPTIIQQFTILACAGSACSAQRQALGLQEFDTVRLLDANNPWNIDVEHHYGCMGSCQLGPCVGIEHDEYSGTVGVLGMDALELQRRVFHKIETYEDAQRVLDGVHASIVELSNSETSEQQDELDRYV